MSVTLSIQIALAEGLEVVMAKAEDLVQIADHTAVLAVDEVQRGDEVRRRDTHERLDDAHLRFAATAGNDVVVEFRHYRTVGLIAQVEIRYHPFALYAQSEHQKGSTPPRAVLALRTMPQDTAVLRRLDDKP